MKAAGPVAGAAAVDEEPRILDTYSTVYAFIMMFLVPGVLAMSRLPFGDDRSAIYTFEYVSLVTMPFLLGLVLTFMIDSTDPIRRKLLRIAVLTLPIVITGVTLMFGISILMLPASKLLGIREQGLSVAFWVGLALVASPLVLSFVRRLRHPGGWAGVVQLVAIAATIALIAALFIVSLATKTDIYAIWRKDVIIYVVGALTWYLPSFGLAAGFWRRTGLV